jgi:hypothetical protein
MIEFVPIGYFPKDTTVPQGWTDNDAVKEICSVSECIASGPENWIEHWTHNDFGYYNSLGEAATICPAPNQVFQIFAFRVLPTQFQDGEPQPFSVPTFQVEPIPEHFHRLGFDIANAMPGYSVLPFFNCSPLSCNGIAKEMQVNQYCLLDSIEQATDLAMRLSIGGAEPGPYFVLEVLRSGRPNLSFNPDAASTGNFLLHSVGFPVSFQRAAVGTAG